MATKDNMVEDLLKVLECDICLQTMNNPRRLVCDHSFCKTCLDKLMKFNADGSLTIKCPKQCENITNLSCERTTNDLGVDYMMKGMLDVISEYDRKSPKFDDKRPKCQLNADCRANIKYYCPNCYIHFCASCVCYCQNKDDYIQVTINSDDELEVLCNEHLTNASYLCCDPCQNKFICIYCTHRDHNNHLHDTVANLFNKIKDDLKKEIDLVDKYNDKITKILYDSVSNENQLKSSLQEILKRRKLLCLKKYIDFLNDAEMNLLTDLDKKFEDLRHQFKKKNLIMHRYETISAQTGVSFVIPALDLMNSCINKEDEKEICQQKISLSDFQYDSNNPLGKLVTEDFMINSLCENPCSKLIFDDMEVSKDNIENVLNEGFPDIQQTYDYIHEKLKELRIGVTDELEDTSALDPEAISWRPFSGYADPNRLKGHWSTGPLAPLQRTQPMGYQHKVGCAVSKDHVPRPAYLVSLPQQMQQGSAAVQPENRNTYVHLGSPRQNYPVRMLGCWQGPPPPLHPSNRLATANQQLSRLSLADLPPKNQK